MMPSLYPNVWKMIFTLLVAFPTSYLVEAGFSAVSQVLTKKKNALEISETGDIPLMLTKTEPNSRDLISKNPSLGLH